MRKSERERERLGPLEVNVLYFTVSSSLTVNGNKMVDLGRRNNERWLCVETVVLRLLRGVNHYTHEQKIYEQTLRCQELDNFFFFGKIFYIETNTA